MSANSKEPKSSFRMPVSETTDRDLAEELQRQENLVAKRASEKKMGESSDGKAVLVVQEIIALVNATKEKYTSKNRALDRFGMDSMETVTEDDMVYFAKDMLILQEEFIRAQVSGYIDVGFHFTHRQNMKNIRKHGLLTKRERRNSKIRVGANGSVFGDGIYTANDDKCFSRYGDTCLIVGRLKGKMVRVPRSLSLAHSLMHNQRIDADTIIGDKLSPVGRAMLDIDGWPLTDEHHEIVLRSSKQCLPMIKFDKVLHQRKDGQECVQYMKNQLQEILDRLVNKGMQRSDFRNAPLINSESLSTTRAPAIGGGPNLGPATPAVFPPGPMALFGQNCLPGSSTVFQATPNTAAGAFTMHQTYQTSSIPGTFSPPSLYQSWMQNSAHASGVHTATANRHQNHSHITMQTLKYPPGPMALFGQNCLPGSSTVFQATPNTAAGAFTMYQTYQTSSIPGTFSPPSLFQSWMQNSAHASGVHTTTANRHQNHSHITMQTLKYRAPKSLTTGVPTNALVAPSAFCNMDDDCVICHELLKGSNPCVALSKCGHVFHRVCIGLAFKSKPQCPICRVSIGEPQGKSPSGTMAFSVTKKRCSGFQEGSIQIRYSLSSGRQCCYHENPGQQHDGKNVTAYLPNNANGKNLLKRLKYSFIHGLSFTVGTSMTTGMPNQCTWSSVHHKTSPSGGVLHHGFPDHDYFENCNEELDRLGVPSAQDLDDYGNAK